MDDREERDRMKASYEDRVRTLADTVSQRERELTILAHVASRVHGENEVQAILDIALDEILERMDLETAWTLRGPAADGRSSWPPPPAGRHATRKRSRSTAWGSGCAPEWSGHGLAC